jgi:hypothetical protein
MRRRLLCAIALAIAATAFGPAPALAADPPTILTAGIDATDHLFVTWSLGAGTNYASATFATGPWPDPDLPPSFTPINAITTDCVPPPGVDDGPCKALPTATSFTAPESTSRDRRYFVKVIAEQGTEGRELASAVWVIDGAKPLVPYVAQAGPTPPSNKPATGGLLASTAFPKVPVPSLKVLALPRTIGTLLTAGVRIRVSCAAFDCALEEGSLTLGAQQLASESEFADAGRPRTFVLKPKGAARNRLKGRSRARVHILAVVRTVDGKARQISRSFTVRR